jgi:ABC-type transport system substrate-binding protein/class 3 adenylate cyclase/DNA-binding beta-propeller fold protein YncE
VGEHSPAGADAIRAFLIADVRGYTAFTQRYGDEAAAGLAARYADIVREVAGRGGELVDLRGDEALCAFNSPRQAIRTAVELQQRFADEIHANPALPLLVGMGIDVGEAVAVDAGFRGSALNLAARLCATAKAGEVLVSEATAHLASTVDGMSYVDRGRVAMKGIAEPVRVMQVKFPLELPEPERTSRRRPWPFVAAAVICGLVAFGALVALTRDDSATGATLPANAVGVLGEHGVAGSPVSLSANGRPGDIVSADDMIWVTDTANNLLLRIDPDSRAVNAPIPVGRSPLGVSAGGGFIWVVNGGERTVSRVNPDAAQVVGEPIPVGNGATRAAFGEGSVWVVNSFDLTLSRIDPGSGRVETIPVSVPPTDVAVGDGAIWVTSESTGKLLRLDPETGAEESIAVGNGPSSLALGGGAAWVANPPDRTVTRVDTQSLEITKIPIGVPPTTLAFTRGHLWVGDSGSSMRRLDPGGHLATFDVGSRPTDATAAGGEVWLTTAAGPEAHRGGTLRVVSKDRFGSLDPAFAYDPISYQALALLYDGLVGYRKAADTAGATLVADLAERLPEPTDDGRTYTFSLRPGIRYSDGEPVRPSDFREGLERQFGTGAPGETQLGRLLRGSGRCVARPTPCDLSSGVVADDEAGTVTYHLREPNPDFLALLALGYGVPVPPGLPPASPDEPPPGTGPYAIETYVPGRRLTLTRNPNFRQWSAEAQPDGYPDRIDWRLRVDRETQVREVIAGTADISADGVPPELVDRVLTRYPTQAHPYTYPATYFYFMNTRLPPFDDVRVRKAVNYAVDRTRMVQLFGGEHFGLPTCQALPPNLPGYQQYCPYTANPQPDGRGPWTGPDMPRARRLIEASGSAGTKVTIVYPDPDKGFTYPSAPTKYLAHVLRSLGYKVAVEQIRTGKYYRKVDRAASTQIGPYAWFTNFPSPSGFLSTIVNCDFLGAEENPTAFCDRAFDKTADQLRALQGQHLAAANKLWTRVDQNWTDQAPWLMLFTPRVTDIVSKRVGNYQYTLQWNALLSQLWVV